MPAADHEFYEHLEASAHFVEALYIDCLFHTSGGFLNQFHMLVTTTMAAGGNDI